MTPLSQSERGARPKGKPQGEFAPLRRLVRFVGAQNRLDAARRARELAEQGYVEAEREFREAWSILTAREQRAINDVFDAEVKA